MEENWATTSIGFENPLILRRFLSDLALRYKTLIIPVLLLQLFIWAQSGTYAISLAACSLHALESVQASGNHITVQKIQENK
jgi:hypothetical protein